MIVTIWRHGQAGSALTDRERELTATGLDDVGFGVSQFLKTCDKRAIALPELVLYSDWARTAQTADIIAQGLGGVNHHPSPALIPGSAVAQVDQALTEILSVTNCPQHVVLVSHQPLVSRLIDYYLGERGRVPSLPPGGLAVLSLQLAVRASAELQFWSLPPEFESAR